MKTIDKIINKIRISPHGIIPPIVGLGLIADKTLNLGLYDNLPTELQNLDILAMTYLSNFSLFLTYGIPKYNQSKKFVKENGIDKRNVEKNLRHYCDRQAYKAAAYKCGLGKEFNEINKSYKGEKLYKWMPEI